MKQRYHDFMTFFIVLVFLGLAFTLLCITPAETGDAARGLENKFKEYFLLTALINHQANNAMHQIETEMLNGGLQKAAQEYFRCNTLLENIAQAKKLRKEIMNEFEYLPEMNCFHAVAESDTKKFQLLENQCRSARFDPELPNNIIQIYNYQKEALNKGCMKQTELFDMLGETKITLIKKK